MIRLYRGKSLTNGAIVVGYYLMSKGKNYIYPADGSSRVECKDINIQTGIKDRNGVDIYVNDNIKIISPKTKKVVYISKVEDVNGAFQYIDFNGYYELLYSCNLLLEVVCESK